MIVCLMINDTSWYGPKTYSPDRSDTLPFAILVVSLAKNKAIFANGISFFLSSVILPFIDTSWLWQMIEKNTNINDKRIFGFM